MAPRPPLPLPMRAVSGPVPPDDDDSWGFEVKWDGMRVVAGIGDRAGAPAGDGGRGSVRLASANGIDVTTRFPEVQGLADHLAGHRAVLDGEVVALDEAGRSRFQQLQARMHVADPGRVPGLLREVPVTYVVFDLLQLDDHPMVDLPYADRRRLLTELVEPGNGWLVPSHRVGDGTTLYDVAVAQGLEGIVAKRLDSPYRPGTRSPTWRKCKVRREQEVVVGGWSEGEGGRSGSLGALLVGVRDPDAPGRPLRFAGGVGTGFTDATLRDLRDRLAPLATDDCPFDPAPPRPVSRAAHWVEPRLVAQVAFGEWSDDGRLRHPSYLGLRLDKDPLDVVREPDPSDPSTSGRASGPGHDLP